MQATKQFFQTRKHDIMAGSFAVLAMVLLLQLMSRGSAQVATEQPAAASPASLGIVTDSPDAPDELARTGEKSQLAKAQQLPSENSQEQPAEQAAQEVTQTAENRREQPTPESNETVVTDDTAAATAANETVNAQMPVETVENAASQNANADANQSPEQTEQRFVKADEEPKPNEVEAKPKPVEQMTDEEIAEAVAAYEQRVRNGEVRLVLEWVLSPDQLNSVVAYYVVGTKNTTITITPGGLVDYITEAGIPEGKLMGDLPPTRAKWPSVVVSQARRHLGSTYVARNANFVLSKASALKIHRTLASDVGTKNWRPGSVFVLRLFDSDGQIQVKLVRQESPAAVPTAVASKLGTDS